MIGVDHYTNTPILTIIEYRHCPAITRDATFNYVIMPPAPDSVGTWDNTIIEQKQDIIDMYNIRQAAPQ